MGFGLDRNASCPFPRQTLLYPAAGAPHPVSPGKIKITLNQPLIRALNRICSSATRNGLNIVAESISG
jgi:hypothetical protein